MNPGVLRRRSDLVIKVLGACALALVAAGAVGVVVTLTAPAPALVDMEGRAVVPESGVLPDAQIRSAMDPVESTGERFRVPSVDLDVPLGAMNAVNGLIDPPGFADVYLVRNLGVTPAHAKDGTVFVATHSLRGGGVAPGNFLIDVDRAAAAVPVGAEIELSGESYTVDGSSVIAKSILPSRADIWASQPGRLVIVTCLQRPDGRASSSNVVITAVMRQ